MERVWEIFNVNLTVIFVRNQIFKYQDKLPHMVLFFVINVMPSIGEKISGEKMVLSEM